MSDTAPPTRQRPGTLRVVPHLADGRGEVTAHALSPAGPGRWVLARGHARYAVTAAGGRLTCDCPAGRFRKACEHARAVAAVRRLMAGPA